MTITKINVISYSQERVFVGHDGNMVTGKTQIIYYDEWNAEAYTRISLTEFTYEDLEILAPLVYDCFDSLISLSLTYDPPDSTILL